MIHGSAGGLLAVNTFVSSRKRTQRPPLLRIRALAGCILLNLATVNAAIYDVGPNLSHATIGSVPWESLQAGDTVRIHWRTNAYREKWVICRQGTINAPISVTGVPGQMGQLPIIDGEKAAFGMRIGRLSRSGSPVLLPIQRLCESRSARAVTSMRQIFPRINELSF